MARFAWVWVGMSMTLSVPSWAADEIRPPSPSVRTEQLADGTLQIVPDRQVPRAALNADGILLEFSEITLFDLTLYFADLMRKDFLVSDSKALQSHTVQFIGHQQMTAEEAWQAFRSALHAHGFATSEVGGGVITIVPRAEAGRGAVDVGVGKPPDGESIVTRLIPVDNAQVRDLTPILSPLMSTDAQLVAYGPANTLIVTDKASNVRKAYDLVRELDVSAPESTLKLVRLEWAKAADVKAVLEALYPMQSSPSEPAPQTKVRRSGRRSAKASQSTTASATSSGEAARHILRILHDERTNSLIVLANGRGHEAVERIVVELDVDVDPSARKALHVVPLHYAVAEEVAAVLNQLQRTTGTRAAAAQPAGRRQTPTPESKGPDPLAALDGELRIAADPSTNALAVVADPEAFAIVSALISELDITRGQVFVDATFVELTSTAGRETSLGVHGVSDSGVASLQTDVDGDFSSLSISTELLSGLAAGVFGPLIEVIGLDGSSASIPTFGIALQALQTHSDVQVMGNPSLLTLDHQEATLKVGRKIPFAVSNQLSTLGTPIQTYERVDVATELKVTPHINTESLVTLELGLTVDEVDTSSSESDNEGGPVTSGREVTSRVMVEHGQTVVIAGLVSTKAETLKTKVPILGDIPLLGLLFRGKSQISRDTHLLVFITPYVLEKPADLLEIRRMKELQRQEFVRRFQGKETEAWIDELDQLLVDASASLSDEDVALETAPQ